MSRSRRVGVGEEEQVKERRRGGEEESGRVDVGEGEEEGEIEEKRLKIF